MTLTTLTSTERLWAEDGGRIVCEKHAGGYLTAAIHDRPKAKTHSTPFGTCELVDMTKPEWQWDDFVPACETCEYGI